MARKIITAKDRQMARRNALIGVAVGCGVLLVGALVFLVVGYARLTADAPLPPEAEYSTQPSPYGTGASVPLETQVRNVERAARSGRPQRVQVVVGSQELTSSIAQQLQGQGVEDLKVYLGDGTAVAQGSVTVQGRRLNATIRVKPRVENGAARLEIIDAKVGRMDMPASVRENIQSEIDRAIEKNPPQGRGVWLDSIEITQGNLIARGRTTR